MSRVYLSNCLKSLIILVSLIGLAFFFAIIPDMLIRTGKLFPEFDYLVKPLIVAVGIGTIPIYIALTAFWRICTSIARDLSFSYRNAKLLSMIGKCGVIDTVYCLLWTIILAVLGAFNPGVAFSSLTALLIGIAVSTAAFLLSYLVHKAAAMKEENDLTV